MLLPDGIVEINGVGGFVILLLKRGEELIHAVLFWPVAVHPGQCGQSDYDHHRYRDLNLPPPRFRGVVGMGVEQGHKSPLSITDSRRIQVGEAPKAQDRTADVRLVSQKMAA